MCFMRFEVSFQRLPQEGDHRLYLIRMSALNVRKKLLPEQSLNTELVLSIMGQIIQLATLTYQQRHSKEELSRKTGERLEDKGGVNIKEKRDKKGNKPRQKDKKDL